MASVPSNLDDLTVDTTEIETSYASLIKALSAISGDYTIHFSLAEIQLNGAEVEIDGGSIGGGALQINYGSTLYENGINGDGGALLNYGYAQIQNLSAGSGYFSGSLAVDGSIISNNHLVITSEHLSTMWEGISEGFNSLFISLNGMAEAINTVISSLISAIMLESAIAGALKNAFKKIEELMNKVRKLANEINDYAKEGVKEFEFTEYDMGTGMSTFTFIGTRFNGETIKTTYEGMAFANRNHAHILNLKGIGTDSVTLTGEMLTPSKDNNMTYDGPKLCSYDAYKKLKDKVDNLEERYSSHKHNFYGANGGGSCSVTVNTETGEGGGSISVSRSTQLTGVPSVGA